MKANNLTICIYAGCNKNCPYCISKMTFAPYSNSYIFDRNLEKARKMAELASVSSILITSKGEPLNNLNSVKNCLHYFQEFNTELQTNGLSLTKDIVKVLNDFKLNTLAISIDKYEDIESLVPIYEETIKYGINIRLTVVLTDMWNVDANLFFKKVKENHIKQITFRKATVPNISFNDKISTWIHKNTTKDHSKFLDYFRRDFDPKHLVRKLPFGVSVYDLAGISVSIIDYCIQEHNNTDDIRSLIYHQDGHMYTSWDKKGSILF